MERLPHARHSLEFKQEGVRMAEDSGPGIAETARRLAVIILGVNGLLNQRKKSAWLRS